MLPTPTARWSWLESRGCSSIVILQSFIACLAMTIGSTTRKLQTVRLRSRRLRRLPADVKYEPDLVTADGDYVSIHGRYSDGDQSRWWPWTSFASLTARSRSIGT